MADTIIDELFYYLLYEDFWKNSLNKTNTEISVEILCTFLLATTVFVLGLAEHHADVLADMLTVFAWFITP